MDPDLTTIKPALAGISDTELAALIAATCGVPQTAPGLLARIEDTSDWVPGDGLHISPSG